MGASYILHSALERWKVHRTQELRLLRIGTHLHSVQLPSAHQFPVIYELDAWRGLHAV